MRISALVFIFLCLFLFPLFSYANCEKNGVTVVFINGIFGNEVAAVADKDLLKKDFYNITGNYDVRFLNGFNPSHAGGVDDLIKSVEQIYGGGGADYDLTKILLSMHEELKTRKILLVGHSQGTFYTNAAYQYLVENGVAPESISVYNIATPADRVAGGGNYLTSSTDKVINSIVKKLAGLGYARKPLLANIDIKLSAAEQADPFGGHSFSGVYLALTPDKVIAGMDSALKKLNYSGGGPDAECFFAPKTGVLYYVKDFGYGTLDSLAKAAGNVDISAFTTSDGALKLVKSWSKTILAGLAQFFSQNNFLGVSPQGSSGPDLSSIQANPTEAPIVLTETNSVPITVVLAPKENLQDLLDDIQEKLDIIQSQINDLSKNSKSQNLKPNEISNPNDQNLEQEKNPDEYENQKNNIVLTSSGGSKNVYPKVLISEAQTAGATDEKEEFIELYNPNDFDVSLTGWYLQRKTKTGSSYSSYAPNNLFSGKKILGKGYFLIAREGYFLSFSDIFTGNPITSDSTLALKNPNGEISDKLGFGQAQDYELLPAENPGVGQSVGRKVLTGGDEEETNNNSFDFELQTPTPKSKNTTYVAPATPPANPSNPGIDDEAPQVVFSLDAIQTSLNFTINFEITDPLGTVSPSGLASYVFRWQEEGDSWQEDPEQQIVGAPTAHNFAREFESEDGKNYYFQVKAKDLAGNESDWQPDDPAETKIVIPKKVLINEIQTDSLVGTGGTSDDWVELYNPNDFDVDLADWSIQRASSTGKIYHVKNFATGTKISSHGYFLIVRSDAKKELLDLANMTCSDLQLSSDSVVYLVRKQDTLTDKNDVVIADKVGFGQALDYESAPAENPPEAKSIERKIIGGDTDNNSVDFRISDSPTPGEGFMKVNISDQTDYSKADCSGNGAPCYLLSLSWGSPSPNLDSFDVQYKMNDSDWKDWLMATAKTSEKFAAYYNLFSDAVYSFRARAKDKDSNLSDWAELDLDLGNPVVINEIGMGTGAGLDDQWLELYNKSDKDIDLSGWKLTGAGLNFVLSGTIPAKGYFLLERNEGTFSDIDIPAGQVFSSQIKTGFLYLKNGESRTIDWLNLTSSKERISAYSLGSDAMNWKKNNGKVISGRDRNGDPVLGTPGAQNSNDQIYTIFSGSFGIDTLLKKDMNPYLFCGTVQVFQNNILEFEPGTVIKFCDNSSMLYVKGTLKALGTEGDKITFTSFRDDEATGDTNQDGVTTAPAPGDWVSIYFSKESSGSELENVVVKYGGATVGFSPSSYGAGIWVDSSVIFLKNSLIAQNKNRGMMLINSASVVDSVVFSNNDKQNTGSKAIEIQGGNPSIENCQFLQNYYGVFISSYSSSPEIKNNYFEKNLSPILLGSQSQPVFSGNTAFENTYNAIILGGDVQGSLTLPLDLPYLIKFSSFTVNENAVLNIGPGVVIDFLSQAQLVVRGTLKALGSAENPVVFKPYDDANPLPGAWPGIIFLSTSTGSELENVDIKYAGQLFGGTTAGAIRVDRSIISLKNSVLENNANSGLWLINSSSVIDSVRFLNHAKAVYIQGGSPEIKNSYFENQDYGVYEDSWADGQGNIIFPTPNLHAEEGDPEQNTFVASKKADIFNASAP